MLKVENLTKTFDKNVAVNNISFNASKGKIFGLLGRNGAGKSTIFRCILNIIKQDSGKVLYNDKIIDEKILDKIGYLPEEGSLISSYTVLEQCIYYGMLKNMDEESIKKRLFELTSKFDIIEYMNMKQKDLSKGNRQKIQFIVSILHAPELLILDEPFSGLDPISVEQLKQVLLELKESGKIIVFSSHRMDHVEMLCEDILILDHGMEIIKGNIDDIKDSYNTKVINLVGKFDKNDIENLKEDKNIINIDKKSNDNYVLKVGKNLDIKQMFSTLKNSNITNLTTEKISLNDIFIDKVGKHYE